MMLHILRVRATLTCRSIECDPEICARKPHPTGKYLLYDLYQGAGISIEYINWLIAKDIVINFYTVIF